MTRVVDRQLNKRFWLEASLGSLSALLFVVTLAWPAWIELALHVDPDFGSGKFEWAIAALTSIVSLTCLALARREWFRSSARLAPKAAAE